MSTPIIHKARCMTCMRCTAHETLQSLVVNLTCCLILKCVIFSCWMGLSILANVRFPAAYGCIMCISRESWIQISVEKKIWSGWRKGEMCSPHEISTGKWPLSKAPDHLLQWNCQLVHNGKWWFPSSAPKMNVHTWVSVKQVLSLGKPSQDIYSTADKNERITGVKGKENRTCSNRMRQQQQEDKMDKHFSCCLSLQPQCTFMLTGPYVKCTGEYVLYNKQTKAMSCTVLSHSSIFQC